MAVTVFSPIPMALLLIVIVTDGWDGYTVTVGNSPLPLFVLILLCGKM